MQRRNEKGQFLKGLVPYKRHFLWKRWINMKGRCLDIKHISYQDYGAKGIMVDPTWLKFEQFRKDMEPSYKKGLWLERINNNEGYSKKNCRWASPKEQQNNKGNNRLITYQKETKNLSQWAETLGIKISTLSMRLDHYGWSIEKSLRTSLGDSHV